MATVSWVGLGEFGNAYWNAGSNWSSGSVPTSSDDVIIDTSEPLFEIFVTAAAAAQSLALDMAEHGAVYNQSTLTVRGPVTIETGDIVNDDTLAVGGTLAVEPDGEFDNLSGVLVGGTINQAGGSIYWGTLDGVTVLGTVGSPSGPIAATIENGLTVVNDGTPSTIYTFALDFAGDQTQDNATIVLSEGNNISGDGTVTLGPNLTLEASSGSISFRNDSAGNATFVNRGTIEQAGSLFAQNFTNDGILIFAGNTQTVDLGNTFVNEGTTEISDGEAVQILPDSPAIFANQDDGTILVQGSAADLMIYSLGSAPYTNDGVIAIDQGATFVLGANLSGGTIASDGSGQFFGFGAFEEPTALQGTVVVAEDSSLTFAEGFFLQGATADTNGTLDLERATVTILGSETLDNGTVNMSGGSQISADDTLDLGPSVLVDASGGEETLGAGTLLLNEGTIQATTAGSSITFDAGTGTFNNTGSVVIGSSVDAQVLGNFDNTGAFTLQAGVRSILVTLHWRGLPRSRTWAV